MRAVGDSKHLLGQYLGLLLLGFQQAYDFIRRGLGFLAPRFVEVFAFLFYQLVPHVRQGFIALLGLLELLSVIGTEQPLGHLGNLHDHL